MSRESRGQGASSGREDELERALAAFERPGVGAPDFEALRASIDAELAEERGWRAFLRTRATPVRLLLACALLGAAAGLTSLISLRIDMAYYPAWRLALGLGVMLACFSASVALALRPLSRPAPRPAVIRWTLVLTPLALAGLYLMPPAHGDHPASLQQPGTQALVARALPCLGVGLAIALCSGLALASFHRGGSRATLLLASASGVAANLLLLLHCPMTAPAHMLLGHLGVVLLGVAAAAALAPRPRDH